MNKDLNESKKALIAETALRLFARHGYHGTTTKRIAAEGGVAEGLIFYYYGGKRGLLESLVQRFSFMEELKLSRLTFEGLNLEEAILMLGKAYIAFLGAHQDYIRLIWSPEMMEDAKISRSVSALIAGMTRQAAEEIVRGCGSVHPLPPREAMEAWIGMLYSSLLVYFLTAERGKARSTEADECAIRRVAAVMVHGIAGLSGEAAG